MPGRERAIGAGIVIPPAVAVAASNAARALGVITQLDQTAATASPATTASLTPTANGMLIAIALSGAPNADPSAIGGTLTGTWTAYNGTRFDGGSSGVYFNIYTCKDYGASGTVSATKATATVGLTVLHCSVKPVGTITQHKDAVSTSTTSFSVTLDTVATRETIGVCYYGGGTPPTVTGNISTVLSNVGLNMQPTLTKKDTAGGTSAGISWTGNNFVHCLALELAA